MKSLTGIRVVNFLYLKFIQGVEDNDILLIEGFILSVHYIFKLFRKNRIYHLLKYYRIFYCYLRQDRVFSIIK